MKLECHNKEGVPVAVQLYDTIYISQAKVSLFSLHKIRKTQYWVKQSHRIGTEWIQNESGEYIDGMTRDGEGRAIVDYRFLVPPSSPSYFFLPEMLFDEKVAEEVMVAEVDFELLHRRIGHMGSAALKRL